MLELENKFRLLKLPEIPTKSFQSTSFFLNFPHDDFGKLINYSESYASKLSLVIIIFN